MKFFHLSDLHLGKRLGETSLLEEQQAILLQILDLCRAEQPNGVLIAAVSLPNTHAHYESFTVDVEAAEVGVHSFYMVLDRVPDNGKVFVDSLCFK